MKKKIEIEKLSLTFLGLGLRAHTSVLNVLSQPLLALCWVTQMKQNTKVKQKKTSWNIYKITGMSRTLVRTRHKTN